MDETSGVTLDEGWWCQTCTTYESDEYAYHRDDVCNGCGCDGSAHVRVEVVGS